MVSILQPRVIWPYIHFTFLLMRTLVQLRGKFGELKGHKDIFCSPGVCDKKMQQEMSIKQTTSPCRLFIQTLEGQRALLPNFGAVRKYSGVTHSTSIDVQAGVCLLYTSPSPRDKRQARMPSSA